MLHITHGSSVVRGPKHQVINDQRVVSVGKEVGERHIGHVRRVILAEIGCPFAKNIVRDAPPRWQSTISAASSSSLRRR
jgi:hypothetical protein